jgi:glycogen synthase
VIPLSGVLNAMQKPSSLKPIKELIQKSTYLQQIKQHLNDISAVDTIVKTAFQELYPDADTECLNHVWVTNLKSNGIVLGVDSSVWYVYFHYRSLNLSEFLGKRVHIRVQLGDGKTLIDPITNSLEKI